MDPLVKLFVRLNAFFFRLTNGRLGSQMGKQSVLLLQTTGRKSGKSYTTPLSFFRDGSNYLIVASNWGKEEHPNWFRNLVQQPRATIQVKDKTIPVQARPAGDEDYERLWNLVTRQNSQYVQYQSGLKRKIPIVVLTPTDR